MKVPVWAAVVLLLLATSPGAGAQEGEERWRGGRGASVMVRPVELTPADLEHGRRQVERMLGDRPGMAVYRREKDNKAGYVGEEDAIYQWAVQAYAGRYVGERVFWDPTEPGEGSGACHSRLEVSGLYSVQLKNATGTGRLAFEKMWSAMVFEIHNMSLGTAWLATGLGAVEGKVSAADFARSCARVEWQAIQKMSRFREEVWRPWSVAQGFTSDEDTWRWRDQEDFEKWLSHYTNPEAYPWKPYQAMYEGLRRWADFYRERFKVFAPVLPGERQD